jgi:hypothetical protein
MSRPGPTPNLTSPVASSPLAFQPQQRTADVLNTTHVCMSPTDINVANAFGWGDVERVGDMLGDAVTDVEPVIDTLLVRLAEADGDSDTDEVTLTVGEAVGDRDVEGVTETPGIVISLLTEKLSNDDPTPS